MELLHYGFQFGPCLGRADTEPEDMPRCEGVQVLTYEDEIVMNHGLVEMVTVFELSFASAASYPEFRLIFSKDVSIEMVSVRHPLLPDISFTLKI